MSPFCCVINNHNIFIHKYLCVLYSAQPIARTRNHGTDDFPHQFRNSSTLQLHTPTLLHPKIPKFHHSSCALLRFSEAVRKVYRRCSEGVGRCRKVSEGVGRLPVRRSSTPISAFHTQLSLTPPRRPTCSPWGAYPTRGSTDGGLR